MNNNNRKPTKDAHKNNYDWIEKGVFVLQKEIELAFESDKMSISKKRYEELIKKEVMLEMISTMFYSGLEYNFRNTIGYVLGKESRE